MLNQDFKDILSAFFEEKVRFLVVDGYAIAFHGFVRATGDIDLWIFISEDNAAKVWKALEKFGAPLFDLNSQDLQTPGMVFQMGVVPSRIDIITQIDGVSSAKITYSSISNLLIDQKTETMPYGWKANNSNNLLR